MDELPYGSGPGYCITPNTQLRASLGEAIDLYTKSRKEALALLYKNKELSKARSIEVEADHEEVAASCGHFSFSLQYFAHEMKVYLDILDNLKFEIDERPGGRTWSWLNVWRSNRGTRAEYSGDLGNRLLLHHDLIRKLTLPQNEKTISTVPMTMAFPLTYQAQAREILLRPLFSPKVSGNRHIPIDYGKLWAFCEGTIPNLRSKLV